MTKRKMKQHEWESAEWVDVTTHEDKYPVYIKGTEDSDPPPYPQDGCAYVLKEMTGPRDTKRIWKWVPRFVVE